MKNYTNFIIAMTLVMLGVRIKLQKKKLKIIKSKILTCCSPLLINTLVLEYGEQSIIIINKIVLNLNNKIFQLNEFSKYNCETYFECVCLIIQPFHSEKKSNFVEIIKTER